MVCLDTDYLVALLRGNIDATRKAEELDRKNTRTTITPITAFELFLGAYKSEHTESNMTRVIELISNLTILEFDIWAAEKAANYASNLDHRGETIGMRDSMIAGIAAKHNETLLTRNIKHFSRIPELKTDTW